MKTLMFPIFRYYRLFLFCILAMLAAASVAVAQDRLRLENSRNFWVASNRPSAPLYRQARASLRATGNRSLIYVEDSLWGKNITAEIVNRLQWRLETALPSGAIAVDTGIVPYEERVFGPLPRRFPGDERLIVLFAELAGKKSAATAGFNPFDQIPDSEARGKYQQRSNEANILYVNGLRKSEDLKDDTTAGQIAHELQRLLANGNSISERELWLSETLAQGAMLLTGFFSNQAAVSEMAKNPGLSPLVSFHLPTFGSQLLFSSFLLDSFSDLGPLPLAKISKGSEPGKAAIEKLFLEETGAPLSFDAIFSNFVSYVFGHSNLVDNLPLAWTNETGIKIPKIDPYFTFKSSSGELTGQLHPYSFVAIDLDQELSPSALIQTEMVQQKQGSPEPSDCARSASVLWKPIAPKRIAIYSVGCDPEITSELVNFRLKILDQPSLIPSGSFKILH